MELFKINREKLLVIVPSIVGMLTMIGLWIMQDPVIGVDGSITLNTALDPHMFIIYTALSIVLSAALVDAAYWLAEWCKKQCLANTGA